MRAERANAEKVCSRFLGSWIVLTAFKSVLYYDAPEALLTLDGCRVG